MVRDNGKDIPVKVLAKGELTKALTVHAHGFSAGARERIEAAGGTVPHSRPDRPGNGFARAHPRDLAAPPPRSLCPWAAR